MSFRLRGASIACQCPRIGICAQASHSEGFQVIRTLIPPGRDARRFPLTVRDINRGSVTEARDHNPAVPRSSADWLRLLHFISRRAVGYVRRVTRYRYLDVYTPVERGSIQQTALVSFNKPYRRNKSFEEMHAVIIIQNYKRRTTVAFA